MRQDMSVLTSTGRMDWLTPPSIIASVHKVLGAISVDPASHPISQHWIQAQVCYGPQEDGLRQNWKGNTVFLNPPYGRGITETWARALLERWRVGQFSSAILLTRATPGYLWWDRLFHGEWPGLCCITAGRIPFVRPEDVRINPAPRPDQLSYDLRLYYAKRNRRKSKTASTFWYLGKEPGLFEEVFEETGKIIQCAVERVLSQV